MTNVFETDRLVVRYATDADTEFYHELWTSPRVMTYVGFPQGLRITPDEIREKLRGQGEGEFGRLLVVALKATGESIGECKMCLPEEDGVSRTDVKLLPRFWGNRYGTEVKRALVAHLFTHTDCDAVEGSPNVANVASIRMQEAVGGVWVGEETYHFPESMRDHTAPVHHYIYRVYRQHWRRPRGQ